MADGLTTQASIGTPIDVAVPPKIAQLHEKQTDGGGKVNVVLYPLHFTLQFIMSDLCTCI